MVLFRSKDIHVGQFALLRYSRPRSTGFSVG
uniref:Ycf15 n=1 Tax=Eriocaulon decemflorum TaxID=2594721 RepID=A0A5J6CEC2_9POAL|nr:Ycf15 [Eriocaulon decemflorum]YP_009701189.1 Ycf15 [Eriocaulon decemflorum]QEQ14376.1 Ycf15 [Eriocaulon decemflorum]QEQ14395.1 Ycf15 [Eriocaulon decemflorum]